MLQVWGVMNDQGCVDAGADGWGSSASFSHVRGRTRTQLHVQLRTWSSVHGCMQCTCLMNVDFQFDFGINWPFCIGIIGIARSISRFLQWIFLVHDRTEYIATGKTVHGRTPVVGLDSCGRGRCFCARGRQKSASAHFCEWRLQRRN